MVTYPNAEICRKNFLVNFERLRMLGKLPKTVILAVFFFATIQLFAGFGGGKAEEGQSLETLMFWCMERKQNEVVRRSAIGELLTRSRKSKKKNAEKQAKFMALFLAAARDEGEGQSIRRRAVRGLATIRRPSVIPLLIDFVDDEKHAVGATANEQLLTLTGYESSFVRESSVEKRQKVVAEWTNWWSKNKDTAELNWSRGGYMRGY